MEKDEARPSDSCCIQPTTQKEPAEYLGDPNKKSKNDSKEMDRLPACDDPHSLSRWGWDAVGDTVGLPIATITLSRKSS